MVWMFMAKWAFSGMLRWHSVANCDRTQHHHVTTWPQTLARENWSPTEDGYLIYDGCRDTITVGVEYARRTRPKQSTRDSIEP